MSLLAFLLFSPYPEGKESDQAAVWLFGLTPANSFHCCTGKTAVNKSKEAVIPQQPAFMMLYLSTVYCSLPQHPVNEILIN